MGKLKDIAKKLNSFISSVDETEDIDENEIKKNKELAEGMKETEEIEKNQKIIEEYITKEIKKSDRSNGEEQKEQVNSNVNHQIVNNFHNVAKNENIDGTTVNMTNNKPSVAEKELKDEDKKSKELSHEDIIEFHNMRDR